MTIKFNPQMDVEIINDQFQHDKRVRIKEVLEVEGAQALASELYTQVPFNMAFVRHRQFAELTPAQWQKMLPEQRQDINREVMENASEGIGFVYGRYKAAKQNEAMTQLAAFHAWLNDENTLAWAREISGHSDICAASVQATRYTQGQFLTRHRDDDAGEKRRLAYVLNLSTNWHPDWGGLLQFYEEDGTPRDAWAPQFNTLSLFDVKHIHAVTYVTPFAKQPRMSVTGWFRATPLKD